ncbi:hypothetical protein JDV02_002324 [Purpureocillium takamizusanense]|uniref:Uncharacterized protein n=1 Tax=Purpureocillium takamizusanense TaxID=2060973 RepID=A0A9Q8V7L4_9HYPO|nr:uncharacterized protein JDV02_002324 [Purpureocillium takamizusanense]UNI15828.1 hypothetical protein JDV02_002324 [Purpureocillium takamizusanense]
MMKNKIKERRKKEQRSKNIGCQAGEGAEGGGISSLTPTISSVPAFSTPPVAGTVGSTFFPAPAAADDADATAAPADAKIQSTTSADLIVHAQQQKETPLLKNRKKQVDVCKKKKVESIKGGPKKRRRIDKDATNGNVR